MASKHLVIYIQFKYKSRIFQCHLLLGSGPMYNTKALEKNNAALHPLFSKQEVTAHLRPF